MKPRERDARGERAGRAEHHARSREQRRDREPDHDDEPGVALRGEDGVHAPKSEPTPAPDPRRRSAKAATPNEERRIEALLDEPADAAATPAAAASR